MDMITIFKNNKSLIVSSGAYEAHYKHSGWSIRALEGAGEPEGASVGVVVVDTTPPTDTEPQDSLKVELEGMSITELKQYASLVNITIDEEYTSAEIIQSLLESL